MASDYGADLGCTQITVSLPFPDGTTRAVTAVQPTPDMQEVTGRTNLQHALVRRLVTPRGTLVDVAIPSTTANYGTDVLASANDDLDARGIAMLGASVDAECRKDERVVRAPCAASLASGVLTLPINVVDGNGPWKLVLAVSQVTLAILSQPT